MASRANAGRPWSESEKRLARLIESYKNGNHKAGDLLFEHYHPMLERMAGGLLADVADDRISDALAALFGDGPGNGVFCSYDSSLGKPSAYVRESVKWLFRSQGSAATAHDAELTNRLAKIQKYQSAFYAGNRREPSVQEIATALGMSEQQVLDALNYREHLSLDQPAYEGDDSPSLEEVLAPPEPVSIATTDVSKEQDELKGLVAEIEKCLQEQDKNQRVPLLPIFRARWGRLLSGKTPVSISKALAEVEFYASKSNRSGFATDLYVREQLMLQLLVDEGLLVRIE